MAVAEAEISLFDKDDQESWLEVDLDASFSDAESSKVLHQQQWFFSSTVLNVVFSFLLIIQVHLVVLPKTFERNGCTLHFYHQNLHQKES